MSHALIEAGHALAAFAREIAAEAIRASGDVMDGAHAEALAAAWEEELRMHNADREAEHLAHALGRMAGAQQGTAQRDELLHLARCLRSGFVAALADGCDRDALTAEEAQSLDATHVYIAAANGAANRLAQLELEIDGQGRLL
jgi:hypothetical protein